MQVVFPVKQYLWRTDGTEYLSYNWTVLVTYWQYLWRTTGVQVVMTARHDKSGEACSALLRISWFSSNTNFSLLKNTFYQLELLDEKTSYGWRDILIHEIATPLDIRLCVIKLEETWNRESSATRTEPWCGACSSRWYQQGCYLCYVDRAADDKYWQMSINHNLIVEQLKLNCCYRVIIIWFVKSIKMWYESR